jgi:hypothetical protein
MAAAHVGAFIVQQDALFGGHRRTIIDLAAQRRLPGMYPGSFYPDDGGLILSGKNTQTRLFTGSEPPIISSPPA